MTYTKEVLSKTLIKLTIEVEPALFAEGLDKAFEEVSKKTNFPGFRPGKMPKKLFLSKFGYEPLYEEAINYCMSKAYPQALEESGVTPVNQPKVDIPEANFGPDKGFTFTAEVEVFPEVELVQYSGFEFKIQKADVTDPEIDAEIKQLLESHKEIVLKETAAELGDTLIFDFAGYLDGEVFPGGTAEGYELKLGSHSFIPGFEEQLVGVLPGEDREVNVTFPTEYHSEDLAGKAVVFKTKVHEVKSEIVPELTDELVAELDKGVSTVSELKDQIIDDLKTKKSEKQDEERFEVTFAKLREVNPVEIPESVVSQEVDQMKKNVENQAKKYNISFEQYLAYMQMDENSFRENAKGNATLRIHNDILLAEIAKKEGIKLETDEIQAKMEELALANNMKVEEVAKKISVERFADQLVIEKTIKYVQSVNKYIAE